MATITDQDLAELREIAERARELGEEVRDGLRSIREELEGREEEPDDDECERLEGRVRDMDDETLVFVMLGLLSPSRDDVPLMGGWSRTTAFMTRTAFYEIAVRWIPDDVMEQAAQQLLSEGEDDDA